MDFKKLMSKLDQLNESKGSENPYWNDKDHQDHEERNQEQRDAAERASEEDGIPDWGPLLNWSKKNKLKDPTVKEGTQETPTGKIHTADPGGYGRKDDEDDDGKKVKADAPKRGRGRPRKDADARGEVKKYDWSQFGGPKPGNKKDVKLPKWDKNKTTKHSLKDWFERIDQAIMEGETQSTGKGLVHKGDYGNSYDGDDAKKAVPAVKRGRGRPRKDADARGEVKKYDWSQFGGPKPGNKKDVKLPKWDKNKTTKHTIKENADKHKFEILDNSLVNKIASMSGTEVDPDTNVVWSNDPGVTQRLSAFAKQNPSRLKMNSDPKPSRQKFEILDNNLINAISSMSGTEVDPDTNVVWSNDPGVTQRLSAFAKQNPSRLKMNSYPKLSIKEAEQIQIKPASQVKQQPGQPPVGGQQQQVAGQPQKNTQVIQQGNKTLGTVDDPQLAQQIKKSIGDGKMTLMPDQAMQEGGFSRHRSYNPHDYDSDYDYYDAIEDEPTDNEEDDVDVDDFDDSEESGYEQHLRANKLAEAAKRKAKPDFLDKDKDGNKKESFKKAVKDAKKDSGIAEGVVSNHPDNQADIQRQFAKVPGLMDVWKKYNHLSKNGTTLHANMAALKKEFPNMDRNTMQSIATSLMLDNDPWSPGSNMAAFDAASKIKDYLTRNVAEGVRKVKEGKDEGKPGKNFDKIADKASKEYGSKAAGKRVAGAVRAKLAKQGKLEEMDARDQFRQNCKPDPIMKPGVPGVISKIAGAAKNVFNRIAPGDDELLDKLAKDSGGKRPVKQGVAEADIPSDQMDVGAGLGAGRSPTTLEGKKDKASPKAIAKKQMISYFGPGTVTFSKTSNGGYFIQHEDEFGDEINSNQYDPKTGKVDFRSSISANYYSESKKISEGAMKDLDYDLKNMPDAQFKKKYGDTKANMRKSLKENKKQVNESVNANAAYLEGKAHGLRGQQHRGKHYEDMEEARQYHEGYKAGLDECYGQVGMMDEEAGGPSTPVTTVDMMASRGAFDDASVDEGNAFTAKLRSTPSGSKFSLGGRNFTDTSSLEEFAQFESWDKQLTNLIMEDNVTEGMTVSISKGQEGAPDSVSVSAQDQEADQLLQIIKQAGLGLFGSDEEPQVDSSAMSVQADGEPVEIGASAPEIEVVDDHDGMLSLIKKLTGGSGGGEEDSGDYEDEAGAQEHDHGDESCDACGMAECGCNEEQVDKVQSEDQMEYQVAEDDTEERETTADENAEAEEDQAIATSHGGNGETEGASNDEEEKVEESFANSNDDAYNADMEYILNAITGGLNKKKATGQTTIPVVAGQGQRAGVQESADTVSDWKKLAGI